MLAFLPPYEPRTTRYDSNPLRATATQKKSNASTPSSSPKSISFSANLPAFANKLPKLNQFSSRQRFSMNNTTLRWTRSTGWNQSFRDLSPSVDLILYFGGTDVLAGPDSPWRALSQAFPDALCA